MSFLVSCIIIIISLLNSSCLHGVYVPIAKEALLGNHVSDKPVALINDTQSVINLTYNPPVIKLDQQNDNNTDRKGGKQETNKSDEKHAKEEVAQNLSDNMQIKNPIIKKDVMQSGALMRGLIVFIVLSVIVLIYFACRHYRLSSGNTSTPMVHKYGVRTRRTDIEMLPLPLDEEEDDDTVFDVGNHSVQ